MKSDTISKKEILYIAAAELFKDKGYNATSIRDIASAVGLEPSSIYSHIKSKEDLLSQICMDCAYKFMEGIKDIYFQDVSPRKKLKLLIALHLDIAYSHPASVSVFNDEWKYLSSEILTEFVTLRAEYEKKFKKILMSGHDTGKFHFTNIDITFSFLIKSLSWSYKAVHIYPKNILNKELTTLLSRALNKCQKK
ncbi:MAG: TetR family transcriptional regulator [Saprospiraceae bacterium]